MGFVIQKKIGDFCNNVFNIFSTEHFCVLAGFPYSVAMP